METKEIEKMLDIIETAFDRIIYTETLFGITSIEGKDDFMKEVKVKLEEIDANDIKDLMEEDEEDFWIDPAGGKHYGNEDDPAAMYI